ncbi:MAG TPA: ABC transporter ATP-binding protein [Micropepsaceae bacterium]|nr:ABC transporter ATP-binding protein [Micropepsaceae bacterium]
MTDAPLVAFRDVSKTYDGRTNVITGLNLDIASGEFLTLLGPSGSGKTTSLMMLAGFEVATGGEILISGEPVTKTPPHKRGIGMVFQNYALFPHMSVADNLAFPLKVRGLARPDIAAKVQRALKMVRLEGFGDRRPHALSGGQQQRVALARALVFEPKLVLMDEPLGALDKQLREQMQFEIRRLHNDLGLTVVYVTHDQGEALTMSDRIAVFNQGKIVQLDTPDGLYERPSSAFVAGFIGENNALPARVLERRGDFVKIEGPGGVHLSALAADCGGPGSSCILSVRPERVRLGDGPITATIREIYYLGDHLRLVTDLAPGIELIARDPQGGRGAWRAGETVKLGWSESDGRAFAPA